MKKKKNVPNNIIDQNWQPSREISRSLNLKSRKIFEDLFIQVYSLHWHYVKIVPVSSLCENSIRLSRDLGSNYTCSGSISAHRVHVPTRGQRHFARSSRCPVEVTAVGMQCNPGPRTRDLLMSWEWRSRWLADYSSKSLWKRTCSNKSCHRWKVRFVRYRGGTRVSR